MLVSEMRLRYMFYHDLRCSALKVQLYSLPAEGAEQHSGILRTLSSLRGFLTQRGFQ